MFGHSASTSTRPRAQQGTMVSINESATSDPGEAACDTGIFRAMFRLTAIAELYGPEQAVEWAQSLLDDPKLRMAFVRSPSVGALPLR
jgi:ABC-type branched-subunit amino acid transport system substrate-binding protein